MQSMTVGTQRMSCCYTRSRCLLLDSSTVTIIRRQFHFPVNKNSSVEVTTMHQRTKKRFVVSSSLGSSTQLNWSVSHRHIFTLNLIASAAVLATAWLFFSVIPALLALRKACETLENRLNVARKQLPEEMEAIRLSGMEISDLTMELSDIGQEITHSVRKGTDVVRVAEEKLRQFASLLSTGAEARVQPQHVADDNYPPLAKSVRGMKEGIVKSRSSLQMLISFTYYLNFIRKFVATKDKDKIR